MSNNKGKNQSTVLPLQKEEILKIYRFLQEKKYIVMYGIVKIALNTGLLISDLLLLKFKDIEKKKLVLRIELIILMMNV